MLQVISREWLSSILKLINLESVFSCWDHEKVDRLHWNDRGCVVEKGKRWKAGTNCAWWGSHWAWAGATLPDRGCSGSRAFPSTRVRFASWPYPFTSTVGCLLPLTAGDAAWDVASIGTVIGAQILPKNRPFRLLTLGKSSEYTRLSKKRWHLIKHYLNGQRNRWSYLLNLVNR